MKVKCVKWLFVIIVDKGDNNMVYCIHCGQQLPEDAKFCSNCGKTVNGNPTIRRKTIYDGEIHKCPSCGERLDSFVTCCPACGYELRGPKITSVVNDLAQKLEKTDMIEQKIDLIRNFYIPNTKEDIYEFFILAISNINMNGYDVEAWNVKLEQAYQKARFAFGNTQEFQYLSRLYNDTRKRQKASSLTRSVKKSKTVRLFLLGGLGVFMVIIGYFGGSISGNSDSPFYMIALIGLGLLIWAFALAMDKK